MTGTRVISLLVLTPLLLLAPGRSSAESELGLLRQRLAEVERRQQETLAELDELRARVDEDVGPEQRPGRASEVDLEILADRAAPSRQIDFHGHLAVAYFGFEEVSLAPNGGSSGSLSDLNPQSSFSTTDLSFFVGIPIRDNVYAVTEVEYELGGEQLDLDQAYIEWELLAEPRASLRGDRVSLRLGKFYVPFGIERFYQNAPQNPLIDRPSPYIHVIPGTFSDTGVGLRVRRAISEAPELTLEYELALMNGFGSGLFDSARSSRQNRDNNASKAAGGRIGLSYDRWLDVGFSALFGEYDDSDEDEFRLFGADLRATWGRFRLRGEYVHSRIDRPSVLDSEGTPCSDVTPLCQELVPPLTPLGGAFHRYGWYAEGTYRHQPMFMGSARDVEYVLRYDDLNEDDSVRDLLDARRVAFGLVYRPYDHFRLKLQYEIIDEDAREFDNNAILLEGSVDW